MLKIVLPIGLESGTDAWKSIGAVIAAIFFLAGHKIPLLINHRKAARSY